MIQIDFLSTLKQLWLMLFEMFYCRWIYLVLSSIFHRTCGSISNVLDYKNVTWATPNLVYSYIWLLLYFLAFVPLRDAANSFGKLCVVIRNQYDGDADEELDYFEDIYIGRFRRNAPRRPSLFPIQSWNMFSRNAEELPRTNNNIKAWHNSFQTNVSSTHSTFSKFLDVLLWEEHLVRARMHQNQAGHAPESQRRRYADCNAGVLRIVDDYPNRQIMDYLRHIAHNLSLYRTSHSGLFWKKGILKIKEKSLKSPCEGVHFFVRLHARSLKLY